MEFLTPDAGAWAILIGQIAVVVAVVVGVVFLIKSLRSKKK